MKILDLFIENIQSHPRSKIEFHPNLNVIRAQSDVGKSVIIRALKFVITNKATKNIRRRKTDYSEISISDGNNIVSRCKDDKTNGYVLSQIDKKPKEFKALKSDIPFEIQQILNLNEVNIQEQKDTFFLLDESPGQVAKTLNKVSGLSDIDLTMKRVNSEITTLKSDIRTTNQSIESITVEIDDTFWSVQADIDLKEIENLHNELATINSDIQQIDSLVQSYQYYREELSNLLPESIITDFNEVFSLNEEIHICEDKIRDIATLINSYNRFKNEYDSIEDIDLSEIENLIEEITEIDIDIDYVEALCSKYAKMNADLSNEDHKLKAIEIQLSAFKICPTCRRPM